MFHNPKKIIIWVRKFHIWNNDDVNAQRITRVIIHEKFLIVPFLEHLM